MREAKNTKKPTREWPYVCLLLALVWAYFTLTISSQALDGHIMNMARWHAQVAILLVITLRIVFAKYRTERSLAWILWLTVLLLAAPLWHYLVEPLWHWFG